MVNVLDIEESKQGDLVFLHIKGRMDAITSPGIEKKILEVMDRGETKIVLNLSEVAYLSSAGMRTLLTLSKKIKSLSGKMVLTSLTPHVSDVLKMSGFDHILTLAKDDASATELF